jgi:hypothetical protein
MRHKRRTFKIGVQHSPVQAFEQAMLQPHTEQWYREHNMGKLSGSMAAFDSALQSGDKETVQSLQSEIRAESDALLQNAPTTQLEAVGQYGMRHSEICMAALAVEQATLEVKEKTCFELLFQRIADGWDRQALHEYLTNALIFVVRAIPAPEYVDEILDGALAFVKGGLQA